MKNYTLKQYIEVFHILFLRQLGARLDKKLYAIKGGCNMRFYFNSIRYSEDLDIDIHTVAKETLTKNINLILNSNPFKSILKSNGLEILSHNASKQTPTTQRWKITLKAKDNSVPINTKIEFSRRNYSTDVSYETINTDILKQYSLPPIMANHYCLHEMVDHETN